LPLLKFQPSYIVPNFLFLHPYISPNTLFLNNCDVCSSVLARSHILLEKLLLVAGETGFYWNLKKRPQFFPITVMWYILRPTCVSFICSLRNIYHWRLPHS